MFQKLIPLHKEHFCEKFNISFDRLLRSGVVKPDKVPQLKELDEYLKAESGFRLMPVSGLIGNREFLNSLGLKVFCVTQHVRHPNQPYYTPEIDICHEVFGHIPMLADKEYATLIQEIGLMSLGVNNESLSELGALYLYCIDFGSIEENGKIKPFGAGIASSVQEIENAISNQSDNFKYFDPIMNGYSLKYPTQQLQQIYYYSQSIPKMTKKIIQYSQRFNRRFKCYYDSQKQEVMSDKRINRSEFESK